MTPFERQEKARRVNERLAILVRSGSPGEREAAKAILDKRRASDPTRRWGDGATRKDRPQPVTVEITPLPELAEARALLDQMKGTE